MFDTNEDRKKMESVVERFKDEMKKVRTGRAHPDMISGVKVEIYGQFMPLNQVSNITAADATLLVITPFDPSNIQAISAAIRADQSLGLNPADDGRVIRVPIPPLTEDGMDGGMSISLGGTSLIILCGVALETVRQLESQMMMRHYKGFLY